MVLTLLIIGFICCGLSTTFLIIKLMRERNLNIVILSFTMFMLLFTILDVIFIISELKILTI
jgi:hypothetical protein